MIERVQKTKVTVYVRPEVVKRLRMMSAALDRTQSSFVESAIEAHAKKYERQLSTELKRAKR